MTYFKTRVWAGHFCRRGAAATLLSLTALAFAGCGGVGGNTSAARVRAVDAAVNVGTANILVNGASANGDQQAFTQTAVSPYLYISGDRTSSFSFNTSVLAPTNILVPTVPSLTLNNNQFYSVFLIGRIDVVPITAPGTKTVNDPRFLQTVVTRDSHDAPAGGSALVRVVNAAPDGGAVDVAVNGTPLSGYTNFSFQEPTGDFLAAPYVNVPAGNVSVQVSKTGTATPLFGAVSVSVSAGKTYTLLLTEPSAGTAASAAGSGGTAPTFGVQSIQDN